MLSNNKYHAFAKRTKSFLLVLIGTMALAFGTAVFIIPFNIVAGEVSGIAITLAKIIPSDFLTVDGIIAALTWILFAVGFIAFGKEFALKTLLSTFSYPIFISVFMNFASAEILNGYFDISYSKDVGMLIIASAAGGACIGVGCALSFIGGGSTGGIDVIALLICKLFPKIKSSRAMFIIDALIISLGAVVINNFVLSLAGMFSALVSALIIDKLFLGGSRAFIAQIVSKNYEEINRLIIKELRRTTTVFYAFGAYSGEEKRVVTVSFTMREYSKLLNIIGTVDKRAFVTILSAHEISGEGWTR